jgi:hypothetical protein
MGETMIDLSDFRAQLAGMTASMVDIRSSVFQIAEAITRLAVLEERHQGIARVLEKAVERLEIIEQKQHAHALEMATIAGQAAGASKIVKVLWAVFGTGVGAIIFATAKFALTFTGNGS